MNNNTELAVFKWHSENNTSVCGDIFYDGEQISHSRACNLFDDVVGIEDMKKVLADTGGYFGVVVEKAQCTLLAGDALASYPLYYSKNNKISDKYYWIENQIQHETIPIQTLVEFVQALYISQGDTLHPEIKRIRPGEVVSVPRDGGPIKTEFYFELDTTLNGSGTDHKTKMETALDESFRRLKVVAYNKPIILFLSGGYDSRLVAYMLKQHEFKDVYTLCHAVDPLDDYPESKYVADQLGFEWVGYNRTREKYRDWYKSEDWKNIEQEIGGWGTTNPTNNAGFVLKQAYADERLPDSGFIVSGHSVTSAGGRIPSRGLKPGEIKTSEIIDKLLSRYHTSGRYLTKEAENILIQKLRSQLSAEEVMSVEWANNTIESWQQDRSEKRYRNHRYLYHYWGYNRWAPLWSRVFQEFYADLPVEYRKDRQLFENYIEQLDEQFLDDPNQVQSKNSTSTVQKVASILSDTPLHRPAKLVYNGLATTNAEEDPSVNPREVYDKDPQYGIIDYEQFEKLYTGTEHRKLLLAIDALGRTSLEIPEQHPYEYTFTELSPATENE